LIIYNDYNETNEEYRTRILIDQIIKR
jgi:hypothetical protein